MRSSRSRAKFNAPWLRSIGDDLAAMVRGHIELAQAEIKEAISGRMAKFSGLIILVALHY